jgi:hypothetical protein
MKNVPHIPLYANLTNHPKLLRLCCLLSKYTEDEKLLVRARLENLWLWAIQYFPDGCFVNVSCDEIATVCGWQEHPAQWTEALIEAGFLGESRKGYFLTNWYEYGGKAFEKKVKDAIRKQRSRQNQSLQNENRDTSIHENTESKNSEPQENTTNIATQPMSHGHPRDNSNDKSPTEHNSNEQKSIDNNSKAENPVTTILQKWDIKEKCAKHTNPTKPTIHSLSQRKSKRKTTKRKKSLKAA